MPGKAATDGSGSKWTRMNVTDDLGFLNVRREHLAHFIHYKQNIHLMKMMAKDLGRPIVVLDVGCGEANTLRMFWSADASRKRDVLQTYIGIDGDPVVIEKTNETAATCIRGIGGRLEVCDITKGKFPVKPETVDLVICNEVLEHIPQKGVHQALRGIRRALRPVSGLAAISTPNKDGTRDRLPADHVYEWRLQELHDAFAEADLECHEDLGVYIQKNNLKRYIQEHDVPENMQQWLLSRWDRFGNDFGSIMTADFAVPRANNVIHLVRPAQPKKSKKTKKTKKGKN